MSALTGSPVQEDDDDDQPWWRSSSFLIPIGSGIALVTGAVCTWAGPELSGKLLFWIGLVLGGSTFAPGALGKFFARGKLGIGLLMTISAIGSVILGYVEEAAALAFLYSIAEALEDKAMDHARAGLRALLKLVPATALVRRHDSTAEIQAKDLRVGDLLVVRPGERIATDGVVRAGRSSLDTSAITGEAIPVEVDPGTEVSAGSINTSGALEIEATATGTDNSLTTIVELVEQAQAKKGQRARLADRIARPLVPGVMVLAALVGILGSGLSGDPHVWVTRALVVLVAASPCALAIAVPVTVVSAIGAASTFGMIVKSGAAFERFGGIRHLALDKTGTLTGNQASVTHVVTSDAVTHDELLTWAASLERRSTHPLAAAICGAVDDGPSADNVMEVPGRGLTGTLDGASLAVGSPRWLQAGPLAGQVEAMEAQGMTVVIVHRDGHPAGAVGVRDELRPEVPEVITTLTGRGIGVTMLTGDNVRTASALAEQAGISDVRAGLRPQEKAAAVVELSKTRPTAMIGDGINDAPALAAADLGIAMGTKGADAAIESADVAFTGRDLRLIPQALAHAHHGRMIMTQNVVLAILIIAVLLPLAISGVLSLAAVVLVHEGAEVIVILNGLRAARRRESR